MSEYGKPLQTMPYQQLAQWLERHWHSFISQFSTYLHFLKEIKLDGILRFNRVISPLTAPTAALAGAGAGNVDNGAHRYKATYVTADGETELGVASDPVTVVNNAVNGKVALTAIPASADSRVTSRKLYRTKAAGTTYFLLTTISDNSTTTYTDNTADASLGADDATSRDNTTTGKIYNGTYPAGFIGMNNTALGFPTLTDITTGNNNTAIGCVALDNATTGYANTAVGVFALTDLTTGNCNAAVGYETAPNVTDGVQNTAMGWHALYTATTGDKNTAIGSNAGYTTNGDNNIFLGLECGYYETGSLKLMIDAVPRASEGDAQVKALVYGVMAAATANQILNINGQLSVLECGEHADNAAAVAAGHKVGDIYRTGDALKIVHS